MPWINHYVVHGIEKAFRTVGRVIVKWPVVFICISLVVTLTITGIGMGLLFSRSMVMDIETLGASSKAGYEAYLAKMKYFPSKERRSVVAVTLKEGENVFSRENLSALCTLQRSLEDNDFYRNSCAKDHKGDCVEGMFDLLLRGLKVTKTESGEKDCRELEEGFNLGLITPALGEMLDDVVGFAERGTFGIDKTKTLRVTSARQLILAFQLDAASEEAIELTGQWESKVFFPEVEKLRAKEGATPFLQLLQRVESIEYMAGGSMETEAQEVVMADVPLIAGSFVFMFMYCILMLVRKWKMPILRQTRFGLAALMMITATLALGTAYGIQGISGESFSALSLACAFIIYGVGIDDTFVVVDAYARRVRDAPKRGTKSIKQYVEEHVLEAYVETSDAITLTTLTDMVAFFVGTTIDVIALKGFCITAGVAVLSVFVLQSTFFIPCLVLDERRRIENRYDLFCCIKAAKKEKKKESDRVSQTSRQSMQSVRTSITNVRAMFTSKERFNFLRFLFNVPTAIAVCVVFIAVGMFNGTWAFINMNRNLDPTSFLPQDSYVLSFADITLKGKNNFYPLYVDYIFDNVDFTNQTHRAEISKVYTDQLNIQKEDLWEGENQKVKIRPSIAAPGAAEYLQTQYPKELPKPQNPGFENPSPEPIESWLSKEENARYLPSFKATGETYAVQFQLVIESVSDFNQRAIHRRKLLDAAEKSLPEGSALKVYMYEMLFSQVDRFIDTDFYFFSTVVSSVVGVFIVNCFFTLPIYALVSTLCVIFVICHILMIFPLGGIDYNTLLVINLILAVGFAVDYCAHIGQHFAHSPNLKPKERALNAINTMAGSVLKAGFSTILAVCFLVFSNGLVMTTLLKCFCVMVFAGLIHALIFMPCMMFLIATVAEKLFPSKANETIDEEQALKDTRPQPVSRPLGVVRGASKVHAQAQIII